MPSTWWVNNGDLRQFRVDRARRLHWAPIHAKDGSREPSWENLQQVKAGDVLLHYRKGFIVSIGVAVDGARTVVRPPDQGAQDHPITSGYGVSFDYWDLQQPVALVDIPESLIAVAEPFNRKDRRPKNGYFFPLTPDEAELLRGRFESQWPQESPWGSLALDGPEKAPADFDAFSAWQARRESQVSKIAASLLAGRAAMAEANPSKIEVTGYQYVRDPYVATEAKRLAAGKCDLCCHRAPFSNAEGQPYLESHHVDWLSRGGSDLVDNVVALCPNCHRRVHVLDLSRDRDTLRDRIRNRSAAGS